MTKMKTLSLIGIVIGGILGSCSSMMNQSSSKGERVGETVAVQNKNIDWEHFDSTSTVKISEIRFDNLQGLWKANKGIYRFGENINEMKLTSPMIMEVKNDTYRRNSKSEFEKFSIIDNLIIKATETKVDTGIINKITPSELTISWKNKSNYTRYYYQK